MMLITVLFLDYFAADWNPLGWFNIHRNSHSFSALVATIDWSSIMLVVVPPIVQILLIAFISVEAFPMILILITGSKVLEFWLEFFILVFIFGHSFSVSWHIVLHFFIFFFDGVIFLFNLLFLFLVLFYFLF